jgi:hypothetical protein
MGQKEKVEAIKSKPGFELQIDRVPSEPLRFLGFDHEGIQVEISGAGVTIKEFDAVTSSGIIKVTKQTVPFEDIPCFLDVVITETGGEIVPNKSGGRYIVGYLTGITQEPGKTIVKGWIR